MNDSFLMATTSSIIVQSLGEDRTTRAGCRCEKNYGVCVFLSRSEAGTLFVRGEHSSNKHCVAVYRPADFDAVFSLFQNG